MTHNPWSAFAACGIAAATTLDLHAQLPVEPVPPAVVEKTVTESVDENGRRIVVEEVTETVPLRAPAAFTALEVQQRLAIAPRVLPPPAVTTETTTIRQNGRVYNIETNTVIVEGRELPYVTVPVLFEKETANLLDSESRTSLQITAAAIKEVLRTHPDAVFDIEGHTSTDGTDDFNLRLSADRAKRVLDDLIRSYSVPVTALTAHGYGENHPSYPNGTEEEMTFDRRVLVVRTK